MPARDQNAKWTAFRPSSFPVRSNLAEPAQLGSHRSADKSVLQNGTFDSHCTPRPTIEQFTPIPPSKCARRNLARLEQFQQALTRSQIGHPRVITRFWKTSTPKSRRQDPQPVLLPINSRVNRFGSDHVTLPAIHRIFTLDSVPARVIVYRNGLRSLRAIFRIFGNLARITSAVA